MPFLRHPPFDLFSQVLPIVSNIVFISANTAGAQLVQWPTFVPLLWLRTTYRTVCQCEFRTSRYDAVGLIKLTNIDLILDTENNNIKTYHTYPA
jgi:hypothetical protein